MLKTILLKIITIVFMISTQSLDAQNIVGEYRIKGNHEMVAAFKFDADNTFQFYFIYGAVDRMAKGTYVVKENTIELKSDKIPGRDFIIKTEKISGQGSTIKISDQNTYLQKGVLCIFIKGKEQDEIYSDNEGFAHSKLSDCDTILVMHTLYPDVTTTIKSSLPNRSNYFELTLNPSLAEVSFKDFLLTIKDDTLTGSLPYLFESERSIFVKR